jgi:threonylcarbamoyladenosine tRNA methylthiotransferase MtaB
MSTPTKRVAFHTLGCKLNFSETSSISRDFIHYGYEKVSFKDFADIYVINTCSVTENANKETKKLIRRTKRINPNSFIALIGCYAQLKPNELISLDGVNMVIGAEEKFNLLNHLNKIDLSANKKLMLNTKIKEVKTFNPSYSHNDRTRSFLKVQDGCDYHCTFCTIPRARGISRSGTIEKTMKIAEKIAQTDTKEIVLTGVNIGDFGAGSSESFFDLIERMDMLNGIERIRISSIEPNLLSDEIIEFCSHSEKFMPHFHIPLQSGSNKILRSMGRRYNKSDFASRIKKIKSLIPEACIGVDVIVGFPTETEKDFMETYDLIDQLEISYLHVFTYSERLDTKALKLKPIIPLDKRADRSRRLHELSNKKRKFFYDSFIGEAKYTLFESVKNGELVGHTDNYIKIRVNGDISLVNTIQKVNILDRKKEYMKGHIY